MSKSTDPRNDLARELERAKSFPSMPELRDKKSFRFDSSEYVKRERRIMDFLKSEGRSSYDEDFYEPDYYVDEHDILDDCDDAHILYRGPGN